MGAGDCLIAGEGDGGAGTGEVAGLGASEADEELDEASAFEEEGRWKACRRARRLFRIYEGHGELEACDREESAVEEGETNSISIIPWSRHDGPEMWIIGRECREPGVECWW